MATITKVSPLAPKDGFPTLPEIAGVRFSSCAAGVRYQGRTDVMLAEIAAGSSIAGVFTRSSTRAAPVLDCQDKLGGPVTAGKGFAFLVNSGNANAFTGSKGVEAVSVTTTAVAKVLDIPNAHVFSSSTGVIGEVLPADRIVDAMETLANSLSQDAIEPAARAIMTTDTFPKGASAETDIDGHRIKISGIAKGSGMIAPDMATMLVYIFTDAAIEPATLQALVSDLTKTTFNAITVDSDTSTSDTLLVAATGAAGNDPLTNGTDLQTFATALESVMRNLAHQVVRDGEGATKFVTINVTGAQDDADADRVARSIANSPLVKTAVAGEDPNWGRVVMAVGKSGAIADRDRLSISFGPILVAENGWVSPNYKEDDAAEYMRGDEIEIAVDLALGAGSATIWTCDLTHDYISINADYRS